MLRAQQLHSPGRSSGEHHLSFGTGYRAARRCAGRMGSACSSRVGRARANSICAQRLEWTLGKVAWNAGFDGTKPPGRVAGRGGGKPSRVGAEAEGCDGQSRYIAFYCTKGLERVTMDQDIIFGVISGAKLPGQECLYKHSMKSTKIHHDMMVRTRPNTLE